MTDVNARLLLLLDSRSPAGGHGHSGGMEAAVTVGLVSTVADVAEFCWGRAQTSGRVASAFAAVACSWWPTASPVEWARLDAELDSRTASPAARVASRALGAGLRRLAEASLPEADFREAWAQAQRPAPHHAIVLGGMCAVADAEPAAAARAAMVAHSSGPASAAVRLLGLDPYAVQRELSRLAPRLDAVADESADLARSVCAAGDLSELPADAAPALELLADVHAQSEVRLFAS